MDTQQSCDISLEALPANRRLVDELAAHQLISKAAREYALDLLYPARSWGLWVSRLLTVLGVSLILAGTVYFFAFNWAKIGTAIKLGSIQIALLGCLCASFYYGIHKRLSGRILLLSASVMVGVFLAVFGQIYQTGADAYNLFMIWGLAILPWTLISEFAALWIIWLIVTNTFLLLWWAQAALPGPAMEFMIFSYLALFNGLFLGMREYLPLKHTSWAQDRWTRVILVLPILVFALIPTIALISEPSRATHSMIIGALWAAAIHALFYVMYRFKLPDMWSLAATILSGCIVLEAAAFKGLAEVFRTSNAIMFLLMGAFTLGVFTFAVVKLRLIAKELEVPHA